MAYVVSRFGSWVAPAFLPEGLRDAMAKNGGDTGFWCAALSAMYVLLNEGAASLHLMLYVVLGARPEATMGVSLSREHRKLDHPLSWLSQVLAI